MPRRTLLSAEARSGLFSVTTERAEMARHYVLDAADLALIRARRRAANRLGFAVRLCLLRHPGTGLGPGERPPAAMVAFVAEQLGVPPTAFAEYATRRLQTSLRRSCPVPAPGRLTCSFKQTVR